MHYQEPEFSKQWEENLEILVEKLIEAGKQIDSSLYKRFARDTYRSIHRLQERYAGIYTGRKNRFCLEEEVRELVDALPEGTLVAGTEFAKLMKGVVNPGSINSVLDRLYRKENTLVEVHGVSTHKLWMKPEHPTDKSYLLPASVSDFNANHRKQILAHFGDEYPMYSMYSVLEFESVLKSMAENIQQNGACANQFLGQRWWSIKYDMLVKFFEMFIKECGFPIGNLEGKPKLVYDPHHTAITQKRRVDVYTRPWR